MERQIPDVWNIFSLSGPDYSQQRAAQQSNVNYPFLHTNWSNNHQALLHKWCDRSSPCDRPRTYDKFYHKLPGNFVDNKVEIRRQLQCSSDVEEHDLQVNCESSGGNTRRKKRRKKSERNYSRTITEREVRHLDRHLSMKKTIRKKIMRDLQQVRMSSLVITITILCSMHFITEESIFELRLHKFILSFIGLC